MSFAEMFTQIEQATADQQRDLLIAAFFALNPSPPYEPDWHCAGNAFSKWQEKEGAFKCMVYAGAYLDAAVTLVPDGWNWMAGNRNQPIARAYVENGKPAFVGFGMQRNPEKQWFEVVASTPALALLAAVLRARNPPRVEAERAQ